MSRRNAEPKSLVYTGMRSFATLALVLVGTSLSLAQSPVGSWKGKIDFKLPPMPANAPEQQKAMVKQIADQMKKVAIALTVKGNKTYVMTISGAPMQSQKSQTQEGTWSQSGDKITFTNKPNAKEPNQPKQPLSGTITKNGKTLTFQIPNGQGSLTFTR